MQKQIILPTGYLFVDEYSKGQLETLSIGDYGKSHNVKADFLGYTKEINTVPNTYCMPLSEKWVTTLSTQYGCAMKCSFCDVPNIKMKGNASFSDLKKQLYSALGLFPKVKYTERLNIHFARMGEPILNYNVFEFSRWLIENKKKFQIETGIRIEVIHPVLTSSLPKRFNSLGQRLYEWCQIKNKSYNGQAGLQLSINSTDEEQRNAMFSNSQISLTDLSEICEKLPDPIGRKYCLNFAYASDFIVDAKKLFSLFCKDKFMIKITPIHNNNACRQNNIKTIDGYTSYSPYKKPEEELKAAGFDVLVFVPSLDEEDGLVTCGNVILGGSTLKTNSSKLKIRGL